jgi:hypothetical protein
MGADIVSVEEYDIKPMSYKQRAQFQHLIPLGFSKHAICHRKERPDAQVDSLIFTKFTELYPDQAKTIREHIQHKEVGFSTERMKAQELKMDVDIKIPSMTPARALALDYTYKMYQSSLERPLSIHFNLQANASPGFPYVHSGIATKGEAVKSELHEKLLRLLPDPIALSSPKGSEALPDEDLDEGKLRTVCLTPAYFVSLQKLYFEAQNVSMKLDHGKTWGKYGYVKQYGGFNRLMKKLERHYWKIDLDVSGWDRKVCLKDVYDLRTKGLKNYYANLPEILLQFETDHYKYVVHNCVTPIVAFHDGTIWRRKTGNNSGSNNTTTDNTIEHTVIAMHFAIQLFFDTFGTMPSYEEVVDFCDFLLFGDDNASGFPEIAFASSEEAIQKITDHYASYNLTVKKKAFNIVASEAGRPYKGISFLGATARYEKGRYVPYPRLSKLCYSVTSIMHCHEDSADLILDKIVAIWDLISDCDLPDLRDAVSSLADFVYKLPGVPNTKREQLNFARHKCVNWALYLGFECRPVFNIFYRSEVGGIKVTSMDTPIMPRAPRKARSIINSLVENRILSQKGLNFLTLATDPFHDVPLEPAGFPDINTVPSIVQTFTQTTNISAPSVTGSGPWECHVFLSPFTPPSTSIGAIGLVSYAYTPVGGVINTVTSLPSPPLVPGYNVLVGTPGTDWNTNATWTNVSQNVYFPLSAFGGLYRVVGCGVEVVNTSAPLYKSGSATCYRAPSHRTCGTVIITTALQDDCSHETNATTNTLYPANFFEMPPTSQVQAQLYPNSRTWGAEEGYYGIGTLTDPANDYQPAVPNTIVAIQPPSNAALVSNAPINCWLWGIANGVSHPGRILPIDCHGVIFSGLNALSTLQVTTRYTLERIPSITEPTLLVLTRPPCPYDPVALEIYSRTIASLPIGCMVKENPLGEWFTGILEAISSIAPLVGSLFGPPGIAIGGLASTAARAAANATRSDTIQSGNVLGQTPKTPRAPQQIRRKPLPPTPKRRPQPPPRKNGKL